MIYARRGSAVENRQIRSRLIIRLVSNSLSPPPVATFRESSIPGRRELPREAA